MGRAGVRDARHRESHCATSLVCDFGALTCGERPFALRSRRADDGDDPLWVLHQVQPRKPQHLPAEKGNVVLAYALVVKVSGVAVVRPPVNLDSDLLPGERHVNLVAADWVVGTPPRDAGLAEELHKQTFCL